MQENLRQYARPGQWNDPDMLQVGNMASTNEDRAHFAMWAMLAAPLIAGNDIRNMSAETRQILTNKEVIAVDQDELGVQGFPLRKDDGVEIWFKPLAGDAWAMAILNRNNEPRDVRLDWAATKVEDSLSNRQAQFDQHTYTLRDLFAHTDAGSTTQALELKVPGRDVVMYRLGRQ
jgi:alpha-galactosidase